MAHEVATNPIKFGTDGWRAIIADEFTFANVRACAQATAQYVRGTGMAPRGVVVGYDTRFASAEFAAAVAEVLAANDVLVFLCDSAAPTPVIGYSILTHKAGGSIVITSSHNPRSTLVSKYAPSTPAPRRLKSSPRSKRTSRTLSRGKCPAYPWTMRRPAGW